MACGAPIVGLSMRERVQKPSQDGEIGSAFLNEMPANRAGLPCFFAFVKGNITKASLSLSAICVTYFGLAAFLR
jgi:hypothetical protein